MVGLIIVGHGLFASGLKNAMEVIMGHQADLIVVDFAKEQSSEDLATALEQAINTLQVKHILTLCDLKGGSPFRQAVLLKEKYKHLEVIAGANLPMLCETVLTRHHVAFSELVNTAIQVGIEGIEHYTFNERSIVKQEQDGI